ncbi:MAG: class I SAM-dependent methyltransferase [Candidatus Rokuibacteriota bacterium]
MSGQPHRPLFIGLYHCARTVERVSALLFYAAAGAARLANLRAAIQREWDYQAADSDCYIASGLMPWEREFYLAYLKPDDRILLIGCGTGRDLLALGELGYHVEGLDVGPWCTARARAVLQARRLDTPVYTGAIETTDVPGTFDIFIFSWVCYSYIPQSKTRIDVLRKLRSHLNSGGRILVSYEPARGAPRRLPIWLARLVGLLSRSDWRLEYGDVVRLGGPGRYFEHYEHLFTAEDLAEEARAAGLTVACHDGGAVGRAVLMT